MPMVMDKKDWMQTVANVGNADGVWYENVAGDAGSVSVSLPEGGRYQVILVKIDSLPTKSSLPQEVHRKKYDFSDLVGTIKWNEDAVAYQRRLRDEW